jgi:hypothetical protein
MSSNYVYDGILVGLYLGFLISIVAIFTILDLKSTYYAFLDTNFGIHKLSKDDKEVILDVYGSKMNFSTNKKLRITLKVLVFVCFYIITLIFVDGCILSRNYIALNAMCPQPIVSTMNLRWISCKNHSIVHQTSLFLLQI